MFMRILLAVMFGYVLGEVVTSVGKPLVESIEVFTAWDAFGVMVSFVSLILVSFVAGIEFAKRD